MPQNDLLKRYLDAGVAFTAVTQSRAESIVRDLVKAGEVQTDQYQKAVADLVERSRKNSEKVVETIRKEIRSQIANLGLATKDDVARIARRVTGAAAPAKRTASKATTTAARSATPAKRTVKKATVKKAAVKKAVSKTTPAKSAAKRAVKKTSR